MTTLVHGFDWPDRVVVGTVGRPGSRTFYLQVRSGQELLSVALEKGQADLLAEKIDEVLDELARDPGTGLSIPTEIPAELVDDEPLETPVAERFRTGALSLGWDPSTAQVVVEAYPLVEAGDDPGDPFEPEAEPSEMLIVRMPVGTARAFAKRTREIVDAGRPTCSRCGSPIDPDGHVCTDPLDS